MADFDIYLDKICGWANGTARFSSADLREARSVLALHDETLLHFAAVEEMEDCVRFMAENGWSCNVRNMLGTTPLQDVAICKNLSMVRTLVECGADVNFLDGNGDSVLEEYVSGSYDGKEDLAIVEYLVTQGADTEFDVFDFEKGEFVRFKTWLAMSRGENV